MLPRSTLWSSGSASNPTSFSRITRSRDSDQCSTAAATPLVARCIIFARIALLSPSPMRAESERRRFEVFGLGAGAGGATCLLLLMLLVLLLLLLVPLFLLPLLSPEDDEEEEAAGGGGWGEDDGDGEGEGGGMGGLRTRDGMMPFASDAAPPSSLAASAARVAASPEVSASERSTNVDASLARMCAEAAPSWRTAAFLRSTR